MIHWGVLIIVIYICVPLLTKMAKPIRVDSDKKIGYMVEKLPEVTIPSDYDVGGEKIIGGNMDVIGTKELRILPTITATATEIWVVIKGGDDKDENMDIIDYNNKDNNNNNKDNNEIKIKAVETARSKEWWSCDDKEGIKHYYQCVDYMSRECINMVMEMCGR